MDVSARLLELADSNLAEATREQARWRSEYALEEREDALFVAGATRFPAGFFNAVLRLGNTPVDAGRLIAAARAFFDARSRRFTLFIRTHADLELARASEQVGFTRIADSPGMVVTERLDPPKLADGVSIRKVATPEDAPAFVSVVAVAYESMGMQVELTQKLLAEPARWLTPHWHVEVLYENGEPAAGAMLLFSHGIAGVYWVGTLPSARGRGHASAIMRSVTARAFDQGARAVILQASPFGEPVYRRLGYREFSRYPWYLAPRASSTIELAKDA